MIMNYPSYKHKLFIKWKNNHNILKIEYNNKIKTNKTTKESNIVILQLCLNNRENI
jgi:hypothetical protein